MEIRALASPDAAVFQRLRLQGLQESPTAFGSSYAEEIERPLDEVARRLGAEGNDESFVLGAFAADGTLLGVTGLHRQARVKTGHKAHVWGMYVVPAFRGQGIGRALLEAVIERARALPGLRQLNLTVTASNEAARALYRSCGFETFGLERAALRVDGQYYDTEYMALRL